jgi:hypothetical protein
MQTNSELWLDRTLRIGACGTWWSAGTPGGQALGTLQLDPDLVAQPAARERVAAAVAAVRAANPPGVLRTTELVYDTRRAWLVVATVPMPTLADLLAANLTLPAGAAAALAVDVAAALVGLHAVGLSHGALAASTVVLTGAGTATLTEVGVLAAVRDAPTDLARDVVAWAELARDLAGHAGAPESSLLADAAATAAAGDLTAAARRLVLAAADLPDFDTREALSALLPALATSARPDPARPLPAAAEETTVPAQRIGEVPDIRLANRTDASSTVDYGPLVRLRFGPGVPDEALLNPRPLPPLRERRSRARRLLRALRWAALGVGLLTIGGTAAWWSLLR